MPFTREPWKDPAGELTAEEYRQVCLIDLNKPGERPVKEKCKLPVRSRPGAPYNINDMHAAAAALAGARGGVNAPPEEKRKAARKLIRLYLEAGETPPPSLYRVAGLPVPKPKSVKE